MVIYQTLIVKINNKLITVNQEKIYIILNKPREYTCTNKKFTGEKNVYKGQKPDVQECQVNLVLNQKWIQ